jgi:FAD/FMN-containing dehydrogenase
MLGLGRPHQASVRQNDVGGDQVVDREAVLPGQVAEPAVEREGPLLGGTPRLLAGGAYATFPMDEGDERARAAYAGNYDRLARVKAEYDPENLFHVNQNIRPDLALG